MKMHRLIVELPMHLKKQLDNVRQQGTSAAGLIRHLLDQHFNQPQARKAGEA